MPTRPIGLTTVGHRPKLIAKYLWHHVRFLYEYLPCIDDVHYKSAHLWSVVTIAQSVWIRCKLRFLYSNNESSVDLACCRCGCCHRWIRKGICTPLRTGTNTHVSCICNVRFLVRSFFHVLIWNRISHSSLLMTDPSKFYISLKFFFFGRDWAVSASE